MGAALIVIDVQNEYFAGPYAIVYPERQGSLARIVAAMKAATSAGVPVVVVRHGEVAQDAAEFRPGSHGHALHPAIDVEHRDHLVDKTYPGTFTGTDLESWLRANDIASLVIAGYMTHMCCDTTTRQAVHLDMSVTVLSDATGTIDLADTAGAPVPAEVVHNTELAVLGNGFATVIDTDTWIASLAN